MPTSVRRGAFVAAALVVLTTAAVGPSPRAATSTTVTAARHDTPTARRFASATSRRAPVIVAAGDIADEGPAKYRTAARVATMDPDRVVALGDLVYDSGTLDDFRTRWAPSWGQFDEIVWPVPGNHEYRVDGAAGFRQYFGITGPTWWARRAGAWLVIGLDTERAADRAQQDFLRRKLADHDGRPVVVAWHRPRRSSGYHRFDVTSEPLWAIASVDPDVRVALWGHDHDYEHLAIPIAGRSTKFHAFVVGTGGTSLCAFTDPPLPYTLHRDDDHHGVLRLRLGRDRWRWSFVAAGGAVYDTGRRDTQSR